MSEPILDIECFTLGPWMTNCYVVRAGPSAAAGDPGECWIIDAGFDPQPMIEHIRRQNLRPLRVILTHAHLDHIAGLSLLRAVFPGIPILVHENERDFLRDPMLNLSALIDAPLVAPDASGTLEHGQILELGGFEIEVRHTPGHSPGGITLHQPQAKVTFVGDTLFAGSIGRYDFPTSDGRLLLESIRTQLLTLPDDTRILPGHGPESTIGEERRHNPYVGPSRAQQD